MSSGLHQRTLSAENGTAAVLDGTLVRQALIAIHFFHRDKQYLVDNGKVLIIDEHTGRCMADRAWEQGLHQLIETREGCEITGVREVLARISYQGFFRRYLRLAGMSGTVKEVAKELAAVYGIRVVQVPPIGPAIESRCPNAFMRPEK